MDGLQILPITTCFGKAGLVAGTTSTLSTAAAVAYSIRSKMYTKAATAAMAAPTLDAVTGKAFVAQGFPANASVGGFGSVYVIGFDAAGTLKVAQGTVEQLDNGGLFINAPQFPVVPDNVCPVGYMMVRLGPTAVASWTFGTNNTSAVTGVTYAFQDVAQIPDRPQIA